MKSLIRATKKRIARWAPDFLYLPYVNTKNAIQRRKHHIKQFGEGLYQVEDEEETIFIAQKTRHSRYKRGINGWIESLARQYNLGHLPVKAGGVFIDCGANVGELGFWARWHGLTYHAFEPEPQEADCCDLNNFDGKPRTSRLGLWFESTELKFYSKAESADSSLIEIADYDSASVLKTTTLDQYVEENDIHSIELLKIEAEGAEPEVLRGARQALEISRYVTVDCGRERGIHRDDTVRDVCNILYESRFHMVDSDMLRLSLLFENDAIAARRAA